MLNASMVFMFVAPNDSNGNPRHVYAVFEGDKVVGSWDAGYNGYNAVPDDLRDLARRAATIYVPVSEYRRIVKLG